MKRPEFVARISESRTIGLIAKVCGVATTVVAVVFDVLARVAPFSLYVGLSLLGISTALLLSTIPCSTRSMFAHVFGPYWPGPIILTCFTSSAMLLASYGLSAGSGHEGRNRGFLADNFETVRSLQRELGLVEESVSVIARHTEAISEKMDNVKREISDDPRKEVANLGIPWSTDSYVSALIAGDLPTIDLFLRGGMSATTRYNGSSALLYCLQPDLANEPVEILKLFVSHGFDLDTHLTDRRLLNGWSDGFLPSMFETDLAPKGYTGGYSGGRFVGSALLWVVSLGTFRGFTDDQMEVVHFLLDQGAEARTTLSYLEYNAPWMGDTTPVQRIRPIIEDRVRARHGRNWGA